MNIIDRIRAYFRSSKEELLAVTWPTREDIIRYTGLVVATVIVFGIFFTVLDFVVNTGIQGIVAQKTSTPADAPITPTTSSTVPVDVSPVEVDAVTPSGAPADIRVEQVPVAPVAGSSTQN